MDRPKKNIVPVAFKDRSRGYPRRAGYSKEILYKEPDFPKPLEYADIDAAMNEFVNKGIELTDSEGRRIPTYTLYSPQRFSEYSQTWEHTDEDGNLLMNFKTVTRTGDGKSGSQQGGYWNIPNGRYYTLFRKTVLDDDGSEHIEVYSMRQPVAVDLSYRINFVTNTFEMINEFNMRIQQLFASKQCYIRVNGRYLPMTLEEVNDETEYSIENRKFFVQSIVIKVMGHIVRKDDYKVSKFAKEPRIYNEQLKKKRKVNVEVEEYPLQPELKHVTVDINISFEPFSSNVEFDMDDEVEIQSSVKDNIRQYRMHINGVPMAGTDKFKLKNGDNVKIKIFQIDSSKSAKITFKGIKPNSTYLEDEVPEDVSQVPVTHEEINIE